MSEQGQQERCIDCGTPAPASSVDTSMLSRLGWRVGRTTGPDGRVRVELRCSPCWHAYRAKKDAAGQP